MKVTLWDYTGAGSPDPADYAAAVLLYTKSTRLQMTPGLIQEIKDLPWDTKLKQLKEMSNTNPGSWEFVTMSFLVEDGTRAYTHQQVRTRHASYAQQTMRVLDVSQGKGWSYGTGVSIESNPANKKCYDDTMEMIDTAYKFLIKNGARIEDARGLLPTNIHTNINIKIDMRNFINMARKRISMRVQDENRNIVDLMIIEVEKIYPWFHLFYKNDQAKAFKDLSNMILDSDVLSSETKGQMLKKLDIIMWEV